MSTDLYNQCEAPRNGLARLSSSSHLFIKSVELSTSYPMAWWRGRLLSSHCLVWHYYLQRNPRSPWTLWSHWNLCLGPIQSFHVSTSVCLQVPRILVAFSSDISTKHIQNTNRHCSSDMPSSQFMETVDWLYPLSASHLGFVYYSRR